MSLYSLVNASFKLTFFSEVFSDGGFGFGVDFGGDKNFDLFRSFGSGACNWRFRRFIFAGI